MITLSRSGDTIVFEFENNKLYLHNGAISAPVNSLSLVIDESNIATFLKAASNDIFLSCSLDELDMTKEELLTWYKENATTGGGSIDPEEVEEIVEEVTENLFGYAEYDSQSTRINFKHDASGSVISYIDASDFVIDGMIDNVEIVTVQGVKYLKITFNTESGKEPILIPLSDIFDPDEYYTKTEVDNALSGKQDTLISGTNIKTINNESLLGSGNIDIQGGGGISSAECQTMIDNSISGKVDTSVFEEKERIIAASLVDLDERKADTSAVTQEISAAVSGKQDTLIAGTNITISGNVISSEGGGSSYTAGSGIDITNDVISVTGKVDVDVFNSYSGAVDSRLAEDEEVTAAGLNAVNDNLNTVNDKFGGLRLVKLTQAEYDALTVKDNSTLYVII